MAILEKTAPNGQIIEFDTNEFSEQEMEQYLNLPKFKKELPQVNQQQEHQLQLKLIVLLFYKSKLLYLLYPHCQV